VLNSIVGLYYYLNVLKVVYLYRAENLEDESKPFPITRPHQIALVTLTIGVILVGVFFGPWFDLAAAAAKAF
jgi:NADH:ubiquinone oxidoreductase subunit 2 (subunit N)